MEEQARQPARRVWQSPRLTAYGRVADLTAGGSGANSEDMGMFSMDMHKRP